MKTLIATMEGTETLKNKTINASENTISNIDVSNLKEQGASNKFKTFRVKSDGGWDYSNLPSFIVSTRDPRTEEGEINDIWIKVLGESYASFMAKMVTQQSSPIVLQNDMVATQEIVIPAGVSNTLDLNGFTILGTENFRFCTLTSTNQSNAVGLTIIDSSEDHSGKIRMFKAENGGCIYCGNNSRLTLTGITIEYCVANEDGGAIYCSSGSSLTVNGGSSLESCSAKYGGCISINNATADLSEYKMKYCQSSVYGGGIYAIDTSVVNNLSGDMTGNTSKYDGGAIFIDNLTTLNNGCNIVNCDSQLGAGGGICVGTNSTLTVKGGCIIEQCSAKQGGGICCIVSSSMLYMIEKSTIHDNKATEGHGGGVYWEIPYRTIKPEVVFYFNTPEDVYPVS